MSSRSKYKYYWRSAVVDMIKNYKKLSSEKTIMSCIFLNAINKAADYTESTYENGADRVKAIRLLFIDGTHNYDGVARECLTSKRTAKRWVNDFIKLVGKYSGYINE